MYIIDDNKKIEGFNNPADVSEVHYVFWTGGFDSTFRLCQALLDFAYISLYKSLFHLDSM